MGKQRETHVVVKSIPHLCKLNDQIITDLIHVHHIVVMPSHYLEIRATIQVYGN